MRGKCWLIIGSLLLIASLLVVACSKPAPAPSPAPAPAPAPAPSPAPAPKPAPAPAPAFAPKLSSKMMWTALDVGTYSYTAAVFLANMMDKVHGMKVRVLPIGTSVGRLLALKNGVADIAFMSAEAYSAMECIDEFSSVEWGGPQKFLALWAPYTPTGMATRADSGIKKAADLKGKRVGQIVGMAATNTRVEAFLAFAGLTWDDVQVVKFSSTGEHHAGLVQGKIDAGGGVNSATTAMFELEASPHGIYWIPFPSADKEGWKRLQAIAHVDPCLMSPGAGVKKGDRVEVVGFRFPQLITLEGRLSDEEAYAFVKALDESYEKYIKDQLTWSEIWILKDALKPNDDAPYHPGVIRYAKEKGIWTNEHEAVNKAVLERMAKVQKAWDTVVVESIEKNIKGDQFSKYWLERKVQLVGKALSR